MKHSLFSHLSLAAVLSAFVSFFSLSADTASFHHTENSEIRDRIILNFRGSLVESFIGDDRMLFSLDTMGVLWMYPKSVDGEWRTASPLFEGVAQASVGSDFLLLLTDEGTLFHYDFEIVQNDDGSWLLALEEHYKVLSEGVKQISAGFDHYLYVLEDGTLMGGGMSYNDGRLASTEVKYVSEPFTLATGVQSASAGAGFSLFVKNNGELWGMGLNLWGNLGTGDTSSVIEPTKIAERVKIAKAESYTSWFINEDDHLYYMGKAMSLVPSFVGDHAARAAISGGIIVWLNLEGEILTAGLSANGFYRGPESMGDRGLSIIALDQGFCWVKSGAPVFQAWLESPVELGEFPIQPYSVFMTVSGEEFDMAEEQGRYLSGGNVYHYVELGPVNGAKPVYRFRNGQHNCHFYTISESEAGSVANVPSFEFEGIAYYAWDYPYPGTQPVYRFYSDITHSHLYILGDNHRDELLSNPTPLNFQLEGVAYYAWGFWNAD